MFKLFLKQPKPISHNKGKYLFALTKEPVFPLILIPKDWAPSNKKCFISENVLTFPAGFGVEYLRQDGRLQAFAINFNQFVSLLANCRPGKNVASKPL